MAGAIKPSQVDIVNIRRETLEDIIAKDVLAGLRHPKGTLKTLPTLLLYNEAGLKLFERITYLEDYYLTNEEIAVLNAHADKIVLRIPNGAMLLELGSGNLRKVDILLKAFDRAGKTVDYYALDLSLQELQRTLAAVPPGTYSHVTCHGFLGTYDDGLAWLSKPENQSRPKCIMTMGSSIGNFNRDEASKFLAGFAEVLGPSDSILVGLDACQQKEKVHAAYNDRENLTDEFYRNGLVHANALLGHEAFKQEDWEVVGIYNDSVHCHEAYFSPLRDVVIDGVTIPKGEMLLLEEAYKYSAAQSEKLWRDSGLNEVASFGNKTSDYHIHMLSSPRFSWPVSPEQYAVNPVPSLQDWEGLWKAWDTVTRGMVPPDQLHSKPIKLRNACIFYLGHIPTFVDIHLTRATGEKATEPSHYPEIFERGIDPDVDNPELCHAHSEIPDTWPHVDEILEFQERVRARIRHLMKSGEGITNRQVGRALWIGFEHEVMHLETFLYMLLQSDRTFPPTGVKRPDFANMAIKASKEKVPNEWITIPESTIVVGLDDPKNNSGPDRYFGWDNETPSRSVTVSSFIAQARPITNGEYAHYLEQSNIKHIPASWSETTSSPNGSSLNRYANGFIKNGVSHQSSNEDPSPTAHYVAGKSVRTIFGPVPLGHALDWPVFASYDELSSYAKWMDSRIPSADEVRSIYAFVQQSRKIKENVLGRTISAVNGHLSNDGVEETPPSSDAVNGSSGAENNLNPNDIFINLEGCNVGLRNWHPTPVTQNGDKLSGQGNMGGVWEWTSSTLEPHEGFKAMDLYPGYTADFFDGKHNIVLGGSWATHPRIAGRKTFVNWYQRKYPYAWCGARLVRDS